ncbi:unnamed protein product [Brachionus calyciflorus]|uniref:Rhodanese domain-containing protein n=1 Tax=Brachionus calyciflorus TaxID=104777 RepID=A0A813ZGW0_9BILA|nr:unnamed protein product [Brachionus calyciflorus]
MKISDVLFCVYFLNAIDLSSQIFTSDDMLIDAKTLNSLILSDDFNDKYRILEADLDQASKISYDNSHILNAIYFDASYNSTETKYISYDIPSEKNFKEYVESLGISNSHNLIIYDRSANGFTAAARTWFLFKVFGMEKVTILNGGFRAYNSQKFQVTCKVTSFQRANFSTNFKADLKRDFNQIVDVTKFKNETLIDARERSEYDSGFIPTAINIPFSSLFNSQTKLLKSKNQLSDLLSSANISLNDKLITYCLRGLRGSALMFVLKYLEAEQVSLYVTTATSYNYHSKECPLTSARNLYQLILRRDFLDKYRLLEADLDQASKTSYLNSHIPTAIYFDASYNSTGNIDKFIAYDIPNEKKFREYVGSLGISNSHHIIIYDRSPNGFLAAARAAYLFKVFGMDNVSILNGGLNVYSSLNFPLTQRIINYKPRQFSTYYRPLLVKNFDQIQGIIKAQNETLIDAREQTEYEQGFIPTSINIPFSSLFDPTTKLLKTQEELLEIFESKNIDLCRPIVTYCVKSIRCSATKFALDYIGAKRVAVYIIRSDLAFDDCRENIKYGEVSAKSVPEQVEMFNNYLTNVESSSFSTEDESSKAFIELFADDKTLAKSGERLEEILKDFERIIEDLNEWCYFNKVNINSIRHFL